MNCFSISQVLIISSLISCIATKGLDIDFSNVDLKRFPYFRYPMTPPPPLIYVKELGAFVRPLPQRESPFVTAYQKTKAALEYFKQVLAGDPLMNKRMEISFDPDEPARNAPSYQRHFGYRGERLVELLGKGLDVKTLEYYGAIPRRHRS